MKYLIISVGFLCMSSCSDQQKTTISEETASIKINNDINTRDTVSFDDHKTTKKESSDSTLVNRKKVISSDNSMLKHAPANLTSKDFKDGVYEFIVIYAHDGNYFEGKPYDAYSKEKVVIQNMIATVYYGDEIVEKGKITKHKSGEWIIYSCSDTNSDCDSEVVGGCAGASTIDIKNKTISTC